MNRLWATAAGAALTIGAAPAAIAQSALCPQPKADAAETQVDGVRSWADVAKFYARYADCDDGSIAEGNAEAIARILTEKWDSLPELERLAVRQPGLRTFVVDHVNATLASAQLARIGKLAVSSCPAGARDLCSELARSAASAQVP